jgi:hypothetical protein
VSRPTPKAQKKKKMTASEIAMLTQERERKAKGKWKTTEVGGSDLAWDPYGLKTLERYATEEEHAEFERKGRYSRVNYGGSTDKAIWFKTEGGPYAADFAATRPWIVVIEVRIDEGTPFMHAESDRFKGEARHPAMVIVKNNEPGAYGVGRELIDRLRPSWRRNE